MASSVSSLRREPASGAPSFGPLGVPQMVINGGQLGQQRILKAETIALMGKNHLPDGVDNIHPLIGNPGNVFGLGFAVVDAPAPGVSHERAKGEMWWYGIGGTWFGVHPEEELLVLGMIQCQGGAAPRNARLESKKLAYGALD